MPSIGSKTVPDTQSLARWNRYLVFGTCVDDERMDATDSSKVLRETHVLGCMQLKFIRFPAQYGGIGSSKFPRGLLLMCYIEETKAHQELPSHTLLKSRCWSRFASSLLHYYYGRYSNNEIRSLFTFSFLLLLHRLPTLLAIFYIYIFFQTFRVSKSETSLDLDYRFVCEFICYC